MSTEICVMLLVDHDLPPKQTPCRKQGNRAPALEARLQLNFSISGSVSFEGLYHGRIVQSSFHYLTKK